MHAGVLPGTQVRIQAPHARQPPGDRPGRQARLTIGQPHNPPAMPRSALSRQEPEHIRSRDLRGRLGHHPEEDLQVEGHRQPGVGPGPGSHERQVARAESVPVTRHLLAARETPDLAHGQHIRQRRDRSHAGLGLKQKRHFVSLRF